MAVGCDMVVTRLERSLAQLSDKSPVELTASLECTIGLDSRALGRVYCQREEPKFLDTSE